MTWKPIGALAALVACTSLVAACTVMDLAPIPDANVPYASATPNAPMAASAPVTPPGVIASAPEPAAPAPVYSAAQVPEYQPASVYQPVETAQPAPAPQPAPQQQMASAAPVTLGFPAVSVPRFGFGNNGGNGGGMPDAEVQCRRALKRLGVSYKDLPRIRDSASCGIDYPVEVYSLARNIKLSPAAKLNCAMAEEAARWVQSDLAPAARMRYLSGVDEIRQLSSYSCRKIAGSRTMSEHSKGNALDIGSIKLNSGRVIDVHKPGLFAFRERSFLRRVRGEACDHFGTVLGPGYNRDHADHFHIDLMERRKAACH